MLLLMWRKDKYYVLHGMTLNWWFTEKVLHLLNDCRTIKIWIHQIAIVKHIRESPVATITAIEMFEELFVLRYECTHNLGY